MHKAQNLHEEVCLDDIDYIDDIDDIGDIDDIDDQQGCSDVQSENVYQAGKKSEWGAGPMLVHCSAGVR